jgi:shikimate dehydrogenase
MTDRYAVIGNPVAHSQSPRIHTAFARALGHAVEYGTILAEPGRFADAVETFRRAGGRGLNVTVPFKLEAFAITTSCSARATLAGAVNTLEFNGDTVIGDNTDGAGLVRDVARRLRFPIEGARVLLMGAGGAARGVVKPLLDERPARLAIANRAGHKALALAVHFARHAATISVRGGDYAAFQGETFDLVINATSASLEGQVPPLPPRIFAAGALAYDMVYGDRATRFLDFARNRGAAQTADGLGMLVEQAAESFLLWRGVRPETAPVLALLRQAADSATGSVATTGAR